MAKPELPDEMDLSREAAMDAAEPGGAEHTLPCPFCGGQAIVQWVKDSSPYFPWRVFCNGCKITTKDTALRGVALAIWNRRVSPPINGLIDKPAADGHTPQRQPRSSGGSSAAGKRATGRKGAQSKGVKKS